MHTLCVLRKTVGGEGYQKKVSIQIITLKVEKLTLSTQCYNKQSQVKK